jgi:hypothetical protein
MPHPFHMPAAPVVLGTGGAEPGVHDIDRQIGRALDGHQGRIAQRTAAERLVQPVDPQPAGQFPYAALEVVAGQQQDDLLCAANLQETAIARQQQALFRHGTFDQAPVRGAVRLHGDVVTRGAQPARQTLEHFVAKEFHHSMSAATSGNARGGDHVSLTASSSRVG